MVIGFYRIGLKRNNTVVPKNVPLQWPRDVFWISVKMRFVRMVVFRRQGAHFKRQQVADVVISQAGTWPGHSQIIKEQFVVENIGLAWAGLIFSAIICWDLRICAGCRPAILTQSPELSNTKES